MELARADYLSQRFQILDQLNCDPEQPVYLAADRINQQTLGSLQVLVALMVLDKNNSCSPQLNSEIKILKKLKCPNIFQIFEVIDEQDQTVVTIERIDGQSLAYISESKSFSTDEIISILLQIASGLEALHKAGIIHGDLNLNNIYILQDYCVKLNPLERKINNHSTADADIVELGKIGLCLANSDNYSSKSSLLTIFKNSWYIENHHPGKLTGLLENMASDKFRGGAFTAIKALKSLSSTLKDNQSCVPNYINIVVNGDLLLISFCILLVMLFTVIGFVTGFYYPY